MVQTLTGDAVDGYKGLPRCGIKTAEKILDGCETITEMWDAVVKAYAKQNLNESVALTQARVARICRSDNYDFKTRKVILWTPPT
jgi:DNA polymerase-1